MDIAKWREIDNRALAGGGLWLGFCLLAVFVRGIRWEETYEHALVMTGYAPYPDGHPFAVYLGQVFSAQSILSAILLFFSGNELFVNALRNFLHLGFSVVPVFLLTTFLTGRSRWGHVAAAFILLEVHKTFESFYPIEVWPDMYGVGQIGMGWTILSLAMLVGGHHRLAWFLIGLMVSVHIGQLPVLLVTAGIQWLWRLARGKRQECAEAFLYCMGGLAVSLVFLLIHRLFFYVPLPETGPYAASGPWREIWLEYSKLYDIHRWFTRFNPFEHSLMLIGASLLIGFGAMVWEQAKRTACRPVGLLFLFILFTALTVWEVKQIAEGYGDNVPFLLIGWMPYRLANHLAPVSIALMIWLVAETAEKAPRKGVVFVPFALLAWTVTMLFTDDIARAVAPPIQALILRVAPFYHSLIADEQAFDALEVFFTDTTAMYFALAGTAVVALLWLLRGHIVEQLLWAGAAFFFWWVVKDYHQFGATFFILGVLGTGAAWLLASYRPPKQPLRTVPAVALSVIAAFIALTLQAWGPDHLHRDELGYAHLPRTELQQDIDAYLEKEGDEDEMLVPPPWSINWLSYTGNPVMADYQTAHTMTYVPSLAPSIKQLHLEVYGDPVDEPDEETGQLDQWTEWDEAHWKALGKKYDFKYVIAPAFRAPNLPVVVERDDDYVALYKIPE